jgi:hypothetical protein
MALWIKTDAGLVPASGGVAATPASGFFAVSGIAERAIGVWTSVSDWTVGTETGDWVSDGTFFTVPRTGWYLVVLGFYSDAENTDSMILSIGGAAEPGWIQEAGEKRSTSTRLVKLDAGYQLKLDWYNRGSAITGRFEMSVAEITGSGGGSSESVDLSGEAPELIARSDSVVTLPTAYPGTNPNRTYLPLATVEGDPVAHIENGYQLTFDVGGLYYVRWGMWSEGTLPTYFRLRDQAGTVRYESGYNQDGVVLHVYAGLGLQLELDGAAGSLANDAALVVTDLRRVK